MKNINKMTRISKKYVFKTFTFLLLVVFNIGLAAPNNKTDFEVAINALDKQTQQNLLKYCSFTR